MHLLDVGAERAVAQLPPRDASIPGHGKGKGPAGYKLFGGGKLAFRRQMTQETVGRAGAKAAVAGERSSLGGKLSPPRSAAFLAVVSLRSPKFRSVFGKSNHLARHRNAID